jgi:hypothetical protein
MGEARGARASRGAARAKVGATPEIALSRLAVIRKSRPSVAIVTLPSRSVRYTRSAVRSSRAIVAGLGCP